MRHCWECVRNKSCLDTEKTKSHKERKFNIRVLRSSYVLLKGWMLSHADIQIWIGSVEKRGCWGNAVATIIAMRRVFHFLCKWNFLYFNLCFWEESASITSFIDIDDIPLEPSAAWTVPALPASLHGRDAPVFWSSLLDLTHVWGAHIFVLEDQPWYKDVDQPKYFGQPRVVFPARSMCNLCKAPLKYYCWIAWLHQLLTDYAQKYVTK